MTALDHDANVSPWLVVAADHDLVVRTAPLRVEDMTLDLDALEELIGERTRVVAFTLASNAVGSIPDAGRIAAAAHGAGALAWADGVHLAPHRRLRARELGLDVRALLAVQVLRAAPGRSRRSGPTSPRRCRPTGCGRPRRTRPGTASRPARSRTRRSPGRSPRSSTCARSATATSTLAFALIEEHETKLTARFLSAIAGRGRAIRDQDAGGAHADVLLQHRRAPPPRQVAELLAERDIYVWDGDYYALEPMRALGLADSGGAVRAGFLHYTTEDEVDRLLEALTDLAP